MTCIRLFQKLIMAVENPSIMTRIEAKQRGGEVCRLHYHWWRVKSLLSYIPRPGELLLLNRDTAKLKDHQAKKTNGPRTAGCLKLQAIAIGLSALVVSKLHAIA